MPVYDLTQHKQNNLSHTWYFVNEEVLHC